MNSCKPRKNSRKFSFGAVKKSRQGQRSFGKHGEKVDISAIGLKYQNQKRKNAFITSP